MKTSASIALLLFLAHGQPASAQTTQGSIMDAWESQVLGALFGTFCGYFPDRLTPTGKQLNLRSFAQCKEKFERFYPPCIAKIKAEGRYKVTGAADGGALGQEIGTCIGAGYDREAAPAAPPQAKPKKEAR